MSAFARLLGTFFYLGYVPKGPGTAGSLGALALAWALHAYLGISGVCLAFFGVVLIAPAIWAAGRMAKDTGSKDPQVVVIDEVVGQWITLAGASTLDWKTWLGAFAAVSSVRYLEAAARPADWKEFPAAPALCWMTRWPEFTPHLCCTSPDGSIVNSCLLWPFVRIPNPDRRFQTFHRLRLFRAANSASAAKAWPAQNGPRRASVSCPRPS